LILFAKSKESSHVRVSVVVGILTATGSSFVPKTCVAQSAANKAAAEALFDQGRSLTQSGDYAQACQKFDASQKLDEGIGTLLYLADCYEKTGRTASAWATFKEAASMAGAQGQPSRQKLAKQRALALEAGLAKVIIEVAQGDEKVLGFEVRSDSVPIPTAQYGVPVPIDPGEHHIEASAPGKQSYTEVIRVSKGVSHVTVPLLADLSESKSKAAPIVLAPPKPNYAASGVQVTTAAFPAKSGPESESTPGKNQRFAAYAFGGLGIVGVGVGSYFGFTAIHHHSQSKQSCPAASDDTCFNQRLDVYNSAVSDAKVSTAAFIAGGALLATGIVLYLTAPNKPSIKASAAVLPDAALLSVGGTW